MIVEAAFCLALNIYFEARNEDFAGQVAVAEVTLNRVENPKFPNNVCDVVKQRKQFSWFWDGKSDKPREAKAWERAVNIAELMIEDRDYITVVGKDATHYHATYVDPYWKPTVHKIAQIGNHIFYRSDL